MTKPGQGQTGFTLLETLVAFAVLVLILGVLFQVFSSGARAERLALEYAEAAVIARSQLSELEAVKKLHSGETQGQVKAQQQTYDWWMQIKLAELENPIGNQTYKTTYSAFDVQVMVSWRSAGKRRQVRIDTLRLANN